MSSVNEQSSAPTTASGGVATPSFPLGVGERPKPKKAFGYDCYEVDSMTYSKCINGHKHGNKWMNEIDDEIMRDVLKKAYHKKKKFLIQNKDTKTMTFMRR